MKERLREAGHRQRICDVGRSAGMSLYKTELSVDWDLKNLEMTRWIVT